MFSFGSVSHIYVTHYRRRRACAQNDLVVGRELATPHACCEAHRFQWQLNICGSRDATGRSNYRYRYNETRTHFSRIHSSQAAGQANEREQKWIGKKRGKHREEIENIKHARTSSVLPPDRMRQIEENVNSNRPSRSEPHEIGRRRRVCSCNALALTTTIGIQSKMKF